MNVGGEQRGEHDRFGAAEGVPDEHVRARLTDRFQEGPQGACLSAERLGAVEREVGGGRDAALERRRCEPLAHRGVRDERPRHREAGEEEAAEDRQALFIAALGGRVPVLGVCLGSQLLARAYGAENLIGAAPEFGWCTVALTKDGAGDPVLSAAAGAFPIFQWHDDTFTLPEDAVRLAGNGAAENQAFRIGRATYGTQFHFEASRTVVDGWVEAFPQLIETRQPGWLARHAALAEESGPDADATGLAIARAWVATIVPVATRQVA